MSRTGGRATGMAVAAAAALVGAWLGFHAGGWLFAIITAIFGAAALGNLALIILDMARDRQGRQRLAPDSVQPTAEAIPATRRRENRGRRVLT